MVESDGKIRVTFKFCSQVSKVEPGSLEDA